jgi:hypothetical protein
VILTRLHEFATSSGTSKAGSIRLMEQWDSDLSSNSSLHAYLLSAWKLWACMVIVVVVFLWEG